MAGINLTSEVDALKLRYSDDFVKTMAYKENRLLALIPKDESFYNEKYVQPINYSNPQSISPTFSDAQTQAATASQGIDRFEVPHVRMYGVVTVDDLLLALAEGGGSKSMFYDTFVRKADGILHSSARALQRHLHGNGWGVIGRVSSPGADTTMTLTIPSDIANFEVGMLIQFAESESGHVLRDAGEALTVTAVNRNAGTLTVSANETTIAAIADGDYIFQKGTRQDSATPTRQIVSGVNAYCVPSDGTAGTLHSLTQTTDTRLQGVSYNGAADSILEAILETSHRVGAEGGMPDVGIINPRQYSKLLLEMASAGFGNNFVRVKSSDANVSFNAVTLEAPSGTIQIVPDRDCQFRYCKLLQLDTWKLISAGVAPRILTPDSLEKLRGATSMDVETRVGYYANLVCKAPGWNGIATLPV